jgi:hypothetical protein
MIEAIVDESCLSSAREEQLLSEEFGALANLLRSIRDDDGVRVSLHSAIWNVPLRPGLELFQFVFERGHLDDDVRALLQRQLEYLPACDDAKFSSARAFALAHHERAVPCALLVLPSRSGSIRLGNRSTFLVGTEEGLLTFYRHAPEFGDFSASDFMVNSRRAYPALYFNDDLKNQLGTP